MPSDLAAFAFALYLAAGAGLLWRRVPRAVAAWLWAAACGVHAIGLFAPGPVLAFTFLSALSLTALLLNALALLGALLRAAWHLGLVTLPCALAAVWAEPSPAAAVALGGAALLHVLASLAAYGMLAVAGAQAGLLLVKERGLEPRRLANRLAARLPPLDRMEALLIELIALSLALLTVGLAVGALALTDAPARGLMHKTVFSVLAWALLVALLWGNWKYGWRGRFAARLALAGLALLALGFLGTKLVLEMILGAA